MRAGLPWLVALSSAGLGGLVGVWLGRRRLARAAASLLQPPGPAGLLGSGLPLDDAAAAPAPAELAPLAASIRALLSRQQALFDVQAAQLEAWRRQAHSDPLTGLANRRHFMAMLDAVLGGADTPAAAGLMLLRVRDLQGLNQRVGHAAADRALLAVADNVQRNEPQTISFYVSQDPVNPTVFTTHERFADQAAMDRHNNSAAVASFFGIAQPILDGDVVLVTAREISAKR